MIDGRKRIKSITDAMGYHVDSVRSALRGNSEHLTDKFIKVFCSAFGGIINPDWIMENKGQMLADSPAPAEEIPEESLMSLTKAELVTLVKELVTLHSEQNEFYKMVLRQNEEMIRNGQSRFNDITKILRPNQ